MTKSRGIHQFGRTVDLSGTVFGYLIVLAREGLSGSHAAYRCRCTCGTEIVVDKSHLTIAGGTRSCGCGGPGRVIDANDPRIAWAAGFFDGEGTVLIRHNKRTDQFSTFIAVSQVVLEPLRLLQALFGGSVNNKRPANPAWSRQYVWGCSSREAGWALQAMRPWLLVKGKQADLVVEFQAIVGPQGGRGNRGHRPVERYQELRGQVAALNVRGRAIDDGPLVVTERRTATAASRLLLANVAWPARR